MQNIQNLITCRRASPDGWKLILKLANQASIEHHEHPTYGANALWLESMPGYPSVIGDLVSLSNCSNRWLWKKPQCRLLKAKQIDKT
ncbi:MAG: hypothetical protein M3388_00900 [Acidobacteriota bacterium]|nr:hypothetical protein [Acidobacteriota bacterium]